ncbi:MAG: TIGR03790 family protein [Verrucomicrobiota bacterium]
MRFSTYKAAVLALLALAWAAPAPAANPGDEVIVIYNTKVPESKAVAEHYAERRHVPAKQVFGFALSVGDEMSRSEFQDSLERPLAKALEKQKLWHVTAETIRATNGQPARVIWKPSESKIRYAVICYGVPFRIKRDAALKEKATSEVRAELRRNEAAVDSELAMLPNLEQHLPLTGPLTNPLYGSTNRFAFSATNGVLMVTRLDGPSAAIARGLVDKAIEAETNGLWGRAYIDVRNIADPSYKIGDDWMRGAAEVCRHLGLETVVDTNAATFAAGFPMSQIAFYAGWYDGDVSGPFAQPHVEFMPGAFAYHLHSYSGANLRSATKNWVGPLLAKGATATMGCVDEPYLGGTPDIAIFAARFMFNEFTFGEAAYASQSVLSWQTTVIGDPLYRPFGQEAKALHEKLAAQHSPWLEWSFLRLADLNLARGMPSLQVSGLLEQIELTKQSAVLTEKLADLYSAQGKPSSAIEMWERALTLHPSPQQQIRIRLDLGEKLIAQDRKQDAVEELAKILHENPDYPGRIDVYRKLSQLAQQLGKSEAADQYNRQISELSSAAK